MTTIGDLIKCIEGILMHGPNQSPQAIALYDLEWESLLDDLREAHYVRRFLRKVVKP